jgi:predicted anti-sigma-YlaC factor YlaD
MNLHPSHAAHQEAQEALPWLANGSLAGAELERVQAHVHGCAACRAELALLHTLRAADPGPVPGLDMEAALARLESQLNPQLNPRLDTREPAMPVQAGTLPVQRRWRERFAANDRTWLRAAVAMQCCAIAVLAGLLLRPATPGAQAGDYRVLGAAPGAQSGLIVMFKPDTPEHELRRIVLGSGARIVGGPTATGAWMLGAQDQAAVVSARLRREPAVTLAEPLGAQGQP